MLELLMAGGWPMIPIGFCSLLVIGIVAERLWTLRRDAVIPPELTDQVKAWAVNRVLDPAHITALEANSPLGVLYAGALRVRHLGRDAMKERIEDTGRHVMHDLERFLPLLGTMALISPLLGLWGTVFGLINMFLAILGHGVGDAQQMAGGIGEALICTAAGITVAIPAYIAHRQLRARVQWLGTSMEREVLKFMDSQELSAANAARGKTP